MEFKEKKIRHSGGSVLAIVDGTIHSALYQKRKTFMNFSTGAV